MAAYMSFCFRVLCILILRENSDGENDWVFEETIQVILFLYVFVVFQANKQN